MAFDDGVLESHVTCANSVKSRSSKSGAGQTYRRYFARKDDTQNRGLSVGGRSSCPGRTKPRRRTRTVPVAAHRADPAPSSAGIASFLLLNLLRERFFEYERKTRPFAPESTNTRLRQTPVSTPGPQNPTEFSTEFAGDLIVYDASLLHFGARVPAPRFRKGRCVPPTPPP